MAPPLDIVRSAPAAAGTHTMGEAHVRSYTASNVARGALAGLTLKIPTLSAGGPAVYPGIATCIGRLPPRQFSRFPRR